MPKPWATSPYVAVTTPCSTFHAKLLGQLALARTVGAYERKLSVLTKADLLIIDDFGLKPMRPGQDEDFHDVIADR